MLCATAAIKKMFMSGQRSTVQLFEEIQSISCNYSNYSITYTADEALGFINDNKFTK